MDNIIRINNLNFSYKEKKVFNDLNLNIKSRSFVTIIGPSGSGKSTLSKILMGIVSIDSNITIDNLKLEKKNIKEIRNRIGYIFENPNDSIIMDTVEEELTFLLENKLSNNEINIKLEEIVKELKIEKLLNKNPKNLSGGEKQLVSLASILMKNPKIIILDEAFTMIDSIMKDKIFKILKRLNNEKGVTIINITHDIEESLYGNEIAIIDNGKVLIEGKKEEVLAQEKILKKIDLNVPFMVDLSLKLKYYDLIDKIEFDMDKLVNKLWK